MFHRLRFHYNFGFAASRFFNANRIAFNSQLVRRGARLPLFAAAYLAFMPAKVNLQEEKPATAAVAEQKNPN
jgi:hypothetical protein